MSANSDSSFLLFKEDIICCQCPLTRTLLFYIPQQILRIPQQIVSMSANSDSSFLLVVKEKVKKQKAVSMSSNSDSSFLPEAKVVTKTKWKGVNVL